MTLRALFAAVFLAALLFAGLARAQVSAIVVATCGTPPQTYSPGQFVPLTIDTTGHLCGSSSGGSITPTPALGTGAYSPATVGTTDSTIVTAGAAVHILDVVNVSNSATICLNFGAPATISGTQCAAGEIPLPPLWHRSWENSFIPTDAVHVIASAASTPASVGVK